MKTFRFALILVSSVFIAMPLLCQTYYYSRGSTNPNNYYLNQEDSWRTEPDGGGNAPPNFSNHNQIFIVQNGHLMYPDGQWSVSGNNSAVWVNDGGKIETRGFDHSIDGIVYNGGTYHVQHTTYANLGVPAGEGELQTTSNFILDHSDIVFRENISYGNLIIRNGTITISGSPSGFEVKGTLTVESGGAFDGGTTSELNIDIANIHITANGNFRGSTSYRRIHYNISGSITVSGGYFFGSTGSAGSTFNIGEDLTITGGFFWGVYRSGSLSLPDNEFQIGGSFTRTGGTYYAVNRDHTGYPRYYLSGSGCNVGLGNLTGFHAKHLIEIENGALYTLTNHLPFYEWNSLYIRGTLNTGSTSQIKAVSANAHVFIYGTVITTNNNGFSGTANTSISSENNPSINLYSGSTIEYTSNSAQTVSARTDYKNLTLDGNGAKTINGTTTIANSFTVGSTLNINALTTSSGAMTINSPVNVNATTTSSGSMVVNNSVSLAAGITLHLNGTMSGNSVVTGPSGFLNIGENASALNLRPANVHTITLARAAGCTMDGNVTVTDLTLTNGSFTVGSNTLEIKGNLSGDTNLITTANSNLTISGSAAHFNLPASITELNNFNLYRPTGASMVGNLDINNLDIDGNAAFTVGAHILELRGTTNIASGSTLATGSSSTLVIENGNVDAYIPPLTVGNLTMNRTGRTCYLGGYTEVDVLNLNNGTLSINGYSLLVNNEVNLTAGGLSGDSDSSLVLASTVTTATIPTVTLNIYSQICDVTVALTGNMSVQTLNLVNGTLNLNNNYLSIYREIITGLLVPNTGVIIGDHQSGLAIFDSVEKLWTIPEANIGTLQVDLAGSCIMVEQVTIQKGIVLIAGGSNPDNKLLLNPGATIMRFSGYLTAEPEFTNNHSLDYFMTCDTGFELPDQQNLIGQINVRAGATVTAYNDVHLTQGINIEDNSIFDLAQHEMFCEPFTLFMGNGLLFGKVFLDFLAPMFDSPPAGLIIIPSPDTEISNFGFSQEPDSQTIKSFEGIERTWKLEGDFNGEVELFLRWDEEADNDIVFRPDNRAVVYRKEGSAWQQVGEPQDVSAMHPRTVHIITDKFSEWTVTDERDESLPVVLSSFSALITSDLTVLLEWVSETETNFFGYNVFRANNENISNAEKINPQIIMGHSSTNQQAYSYQDSEVVTGICYYYWLEMIDLDLTTHFHGPLSILVEKEEEPEESHITPLVTALIGAYPNPFNPAASIRFSLAEPTRVSLTIYNLLGQKTKSLLMKQHYPEGSHTIIWNGKDEYGKDAASGVYFYRMETSDGYDSIKKFLRLK
jgi:hypothetical protein